MRAGGRARAGARLPRFDPIGETGGGGGALDNAIRADLIGFGQSDKPAIEYRFADHVRHLDAFIAAAGIPSAYLPIAGAPADVYATLERAHEALAHSRYPKLLFVGDPGALVSPAFAGPFAARLHQCTLVRLGAGAHYLQEDHPEEIGRSVAAWIAAIEAARRDHSAA